jgi:hypothetical protein
MSREEVIFGVVIAICLTVIACKFMDMINRIGDDYRFQDGIKAERWEDES